MVGTSRPDHQGIPMTYAVVIVLGLIFVSSLYLDLVNPAQVN